MKKKYYNDYDWLYKEYIINKKTTIQIAKEIGITPQSISAFLIKYNIPRRPSVGRVGKDNLNYTNGKTKEHEWIRNRLDGTHKAIAFREYIYKRDNHTCACCGKKWNGEGRRFNIHHILSLFEHDYYDEYNAILLCAQCHTFAHRKDDKNYIGEDAYNKNKKRIMNIKEEVAI